MEDVAHGTVVQYHDPTQVRLDMAEVFDVGAIPVCAVLAVVTRGEVFAL